MRATGPRSDGTSDGSLTSGATPSVRRRWIDLVLLAAALLVLIVSIAAARQALSDLEVGVFRWANELPDAIRPGVWPLMQYGTFITIPLLTVIALALGRWRLAVAIAISGVGVYLLARVVKEWVERGRPGALLGGVEMREVFGEGSLGFPSGHAAVAAALTVVAFGYLSGRWIAVALTLATIVAFGRMYVGAHLPLDLLGGFALGVVIASTTNLVMGVPAARANPRPSTPNASPGSAR